MECSCGGYTTLHQVTRDKALAGEFSQCVACGRVLWIFSQEEVRAIDQERASVKQAKQQQLEL